MALLLPLLATLLVYREVGTFSFVNFDDDLYVYENPRITEGLSWSSAAWAFTTGHAQVWIPATWLSLQADAALSGPGPAGFHRTNLGLHLLSVVLVWLLARRLTGDVPAATLAAALFGVHPLNVEAVAWITGRKDVLMAPLLFGSVLAWLSMTGRARWPVVGTLAVLAMLAKPAAVVVPGLLLLATLWESSRAGPAGAARRPGVGSWGFLAALSAAAGAVALATVRLARGGDLGVPPPESPAQRLAEAVTGVGRYLERLVWPRHLSVRYPESGLETSPAVAVVLGLVLLALTAAVVLGRRRVPLAAFGWFWFLLCLLPSSGLVQGGQLPQGDRYVYVGAVGLWIAGSAALARAAAGRARGRWLVLALAAALTAGAAAAASRQVAVWRNGEALWRHALAVTRDNDIAHQNLAVLLDTAGRPEEALSQVEAAIAIRPRSETLFNAGNICAGLQRAGDAERYYRGALQLNPDLVAAAQNLGSCWERRADWARRARYCSPRRPGGRSSLRCSTTWRWWRGCRAMAWRRPSAAATRSHWSRAMPPPAICRAGCGQPERRAAEDDQSGSRSSVENRWRSVSRWRWRSSRVSVLRSVDMERPSTFLMNCCRLLSTSAAISSECFLRTKPTCLSFSSSR